MRGEGGVIFSYVMVAEGKRGAESESFFSL